MLELPYLSHTTVLQTEVDCLGWTDGQNFRAYGLHFGLRSNTSAILEQAVSHLPLGWQPTPTGEVSTNEVDILYSLRQASPSKRKGQRNYHLLYCGSALLSRTLELPQLFDTLEQHAELLTAFRAQDCLFVHTGVVGWRNRAILIPGRSMTGKTSLVRALVEAGATYYSDEFAVLDKEGLVHPYPRPLSIRGDNEPVGRKTPVESFGGQAGVEPLPVGLIIVTEYQPRATWRPRKLTSGQALLALMDNTVSARRNPGHSMPILKQAVTGAITLKSKRSEAGGGIHVVSVAVNPARSVSRSSSTSSVTETSSSVDEVSVYLQSKLVASVFGVELSQRRQRLYFYDVLNQT